MFSIVRDLLRFWSILWTAGARGGVGGKFQSSAHLSFSRCCTASEEPGALNALKRRCDRTALGTGSCGRCRRYR